MQLNITTNLDAVRRQFAGLEKQVNFAASKALNETAREVRKAIPAGLRSSLDRPTPFTAGEGATFVKPAKRDSLVAEVLFKDRQASYMRYQVEGGVRQPGSRGIKLPGNIQLNTFGNIPRGTIDKLKQAAKDGRFSATIARRLQVNGNRRKGAAPIQLFFGKPAGNGWDGAPMGIWRRIPGRMGQLSKLIPVIVFEDTPARYRKRVDMLAIARTVVATTFSPAFARALREALASAR
jgi:hypothetical protein